MDSAMKKVRLHNRNAIEAHRVRCTSLGPTKMIWGSRRQFLARFCTAPTGAWRGHLPPQLKAKNGKGVMLCLRRRVVTIKKTVYRASGNGIGVFKWADGQMGFL